MKVLSFDCYWQKPAITEQHAFEKVKFFHDDNGDDLIYLAFPWATLFDLHDRNQGSVYKKLTDFLHRVTSRIPQNSRVVTVCQHIRLEQHKNFLIDSGVTDVFWCHCASNFSIPGLSIYPFPLFPAIQVKAKYLQHRAYLAGFVGAKANQYYMAETRNKLSSIFHGFSDVYIELKEGWDFDETVYKTQMAAKIFEPTSFKSDVMYADILRDSIFALCPSGTGPNSYRLWEAIHAQVIPVILADTYIPPGNVSLWEEACIIAKESEIDKLPSILLEHNSKPALLEAKMIALKQLKFLYGIENFVSDIIEFEQKNKCKSTLDASITKIASRALMGNKQATSIIGLHQKSSSLLGREAQSSGYLDFVINKS
ncbi:exostosin domain-containing protein [Alteromonas sp. A079]|uniref:exostosin domain-containing protein n=1 Tax=Alteromonas sp. A079 TaxID=3410268 RepID=UPI003BA3E126